MKVDHATMRNGSCPKVTKLPSSDYTNANIEDTILPPHLRSFLTSPFASKPAVEMEVIVLDSSSDEDPGPQPAPVPPQSSAPESVSNWRGLSASGVYDDALRSALAMVSELNGDKAATPQAGRRKRRVASATVTKPMAKKSASMNVHVRGAGVGEKRSNATAQKQADVVDLLSSSSDDDGGRSTSEGGNVLMRPVKRTSPQRTEPGKSPVVKRKRLRRYDSGFKRSAVQSPNAGNKGKAKQKIRKIRRRRSPTLMATSCESMDDDSEWLSSDSSGVSLPSLTSTLVLSSDDESHKPPARKITKNIGLTTTTTVSSVRARPGEAVRVGGEIRTACDSMFTKKPPPTKSPAIAKVTKEKVDKITEMSESPLVASKWDAAVRAYLNDGVKGQIGRNTKQLQRTLRYSASLNDEDIFEYITSPVSREKGKCGQLSSRKAVSALGSAKSHRKTANRSQVIISTEPKRSSSQIQPWQVCRKSMSDFEVELNARETPREMKSTSVKAATSDAKLAPPDTLKDAFSSWSRSSTAVSSMDISRGENQSTQRKRPTRRRLDVSFNPDRISLEEIQAQEVALARIRSEKAAIDMFRTGGSPEKSNRASPEKKMPSRTNTEVNLCTSSDEAMAVASVETADTKSVQSERVLSAASSPSAPLLVVRRSPTRVPVPSEVVNEVVATFKPTRTTRRKVRKPTKRVVDMVPETHARIKWRGPAPQNLLLTDGIQPFGDANVEPLSHFDMTKELEQKCAFLSTFGQSQHLSSSFYAFDDSKNHEPRRQRDIDEHVRSVLTRYLLTIRRCNSIRANAVISASRAVTKSYLKAQLRERQSLHMSIVKKRWSIEKQPFEISDPHSRRGHDLSVFYERADSVGRQFRVDKSAKVVTLPVVRGLSRSITCITLSTNVNVEDDPLLRFMEDHPVWDAASGEDKEVNGEFGLSSTAADDEITEYALRIVIAECGDSERVFTALKTVGGLSQAYTDYSTLKKSYDARWMASRRLTDAISVIRRAQEENVVFKGLRLLQSNFALKPYAEMTLRERMLPPQSYFDSSIVRMRLEDVSVAAGDCSVQAEINVRRTDKYDAIQTSYRDLFCRICYCYDCQEHGIEQPQPVRRTDPMYPRIKYRQQVWSDDDESDCDSEISERESVMSLDSDDAENGPRNNVRRSSRSLTVISSTATSMWQAQERQRRVLHPGTRRSVLNAVDSTEYIDSSHVDFLGHTVSSLANGDSPCSVGCWRARPRDTSCTSDVQPSFQVVIEKLYNIIGNNACMIAALVVPLTCGGVHDILEKIRVQSRRNDDEWVDTPKGTRRSKKMSRASGRVSRNRELVKRTQSYRSAERANLHAYVACSHDGSCDSTECGCLRRDHHCERACGCPRDCPNRFRGCRCAPGACRTDVCACHVAGRECDPDTCFSCGASSVALLPFRDLLPGFRAATCANVNVQRGARAKIGVGFSEVHGWGAFAMVAIERGDFIAEYPGELLSQDEAERRGHVYDRIAMSYLFDLNEDEVVDALRKGNKSRYINHNVPALANCEAKIFRVGPSHRITLWAKRDIKVGEELSFDYGHKSNVTPDWSQVREELKTPARLPKQ